MIYHSQTVHIRLFSNIIYFLFCLDRFNILQDIAFDRPAGRQAAFTGLTQLLLAFRIKVGTYAE